MMKIIFMIVATLSLIHGRMQASNNRRLAGGYRERSTRATTKITLTDSEGTFTSPNYPNAYDSSTKVIYIIKAGGPVTITCNAFELQSNSNCKKDYLSIKDTTVTKYCGTTGPTNYKSTKSKVKIIFRSNKKKNFTGFSCSYKLTDNGNDELDKFQAEVEEAYSSNTCGSMAGNECGCSGITKDDSLSGEVIVGTIRLVFTNGIPNHDYEIGQSTPNPNIACKHELYIAVPANPVKGATYNEYGMGPVGISVASGAFLYNHLSTPNGDIAVVAESESFDTCNGHSDPFCRYHYHMIPKCLYEGGDCKHIGYMRDGFPVYSFCTDPNDSSKILTSCYQLNEGASGSHRTHYTYNDDNFNSGACDLDRANGYTFPNGTYAYIFTVDYPFIMAGYYGTQLADTCYI